MLLIMVRDGLTMRTLSDSDAAEAYAAVDGCRGYLRRWLPWVDATDSPEALAAVIRRWGVSYRFGHDVALGIFMGGSYVGNIGLHDMGRPNRSGMIGYWLAEGAQGRGVMTDCVRALAGYGFHWLGLNRIYVNCAEGNGRSRAVPLRLGFTEEGTLQDGEHLYGTFHDLKVYGTVARNWPHEGPFFIVAPEARDKAKAMGLRDEFLSVGETWIHGGSGLSDVGPDGYEDWVGDVARFREEAPEGRVEASTYLAAQGGRPVGTVQVRHRLNDALLCSGGHVGFAVRPSERRKGYATKTLTLALAKCRAMGIGSALVTCDKDNAGSAATIRRCGGVLEDERIGAGGKATQRYWVRVV